MAKAKPPGKKTSPTENEDQENEGQEGSEDSDKDSEDGEDENRRINAIVTNRVKREMKGVLASLAQMQETLTKMSTKPAVDEDAEDGEPEVPKKSVEDPKATKRFTRLEKELAEEREARKKAERIQAEQAESAKRNEMRGQFQQALTEHGISDPRLMRAALDQLEQDGFMVRDEGDKIRFKGNDKYGIETLFDPKVGLKNWVQQEGKSFVPAVDAGGSGSNPARNNMGSNPSKGEFSKLSAAQKAAIEIDRASQGLPPLE